MNGKEQPTRLQAPPAIARRQSGHDASWKAAGLVFLLALLGAGLSGCGRDEPGEDPLTPGEDPVQNAPTPPTD